MALTVEFGLDGNDALIIIVSDPDDYTYETQQAFRIDEDYDIQRVHVNTGGFLEPFGDYLRFSSLNYLSRIITGGLGVPIEE